MRTGLSLFLAATVALLTVPPTEAADQGLQGQNGPQLYTRFCASCHGADGYGNGPVAASFRVSVPDLTQIARRHGGTFPDEEIRRIIDGRHAFPAHGESMMPVWGYQFDSEDSGQIIGKLTAYLKSIQKPALKVRFPAYGAPLRQ